MRVVDSVVCLALQGQVIGWGWDAVGAVGRKEAFEGNFMTSVRFASGIERKDSQSIQNIEILVLGEIECGKMRERKVSKITLVFPAWSTE